MGERRAARPAGRGKTHFALSLVVAAAESGRRVFFTTLAELLYSLEDAQAAGPLTQLNGANLLHLLERHGVRAKIDLAEAKAAAKSAGRAASAR